MLPAAPNEKDSLFAFRLAMGTRELETDKRMDPVLVSDDGRRDRPK